jgi:DNA invertase Pin-like site-specific DNA recombinase
MSERTKISEQHRQRRAVVYVRQSTLAQVERHVESAQRQYALVERAVELGWPREAVAVVDEDTGRSAASTDGRLGFRELVAEVGLGRVGLILALETSRLARSSADWHQLLDLCALTGTLIADQDGVYAPGHFNDRLLLGLKGTMSEAELHLIRARLDGGLRHKAERGELRLALPVGLDRDDEGRIVLSPDEQVRSAIERVYVLWRRLGSARQVVAELLAEGQKLPRRTVGERRIRWARPSYGAVHDFLTNPAYAGAFVFGRKRREKRLGPDGHVVVKTVELPPERWAVCLPDHHPGYVSWPDYLATRERLRQNVRPRGEGGGAAREGAALLQGIVRCGRCGRRMQVAYSGANGRVPRYHCVRGRDLHGTGKACQGLGGIRLDKAVAAAFLEAVSPAGVAAAAGAVAELEAQHEARLAQQRLARERAEYEAARAKRQYDACEPEHRLVARTLERAYEEALAEVEREQSTLAALEQARPAPLSEAERRALDRLARDLPRLWTAPTTSDRDRKELLRALIREVVVTVHRDEAQAAVEVFWEGGARSELGLRLNQGGHMPHTTPEDTVTLIRRLACQHSDREIAIILNKQGRRTGKGLPFSERRVKHVRQRHAIPAAPPPDPERKIVTIQEAARELAVSTATIRRWLVAGLLPAEQTTPHAPWRIRLSDQVRRRFVPEVPEGYLPLAEAAERLGFARQTVLHKVQRGELHAVEVTKGRRKGLRIQVSAWIHRGACDLPLIAAPRVSVAAVAGRCRAFGGIDSWVGAGSGEGCVFGQRWSVSGGADRRLRVAVAQAAAGKARIRSSASTKSRCQGQAAGRWSVQRPA